jgi:glycosyltransferase involved in cell wall biosynthesis
MALDAFVEVSKASPEARLFFVGDGKLEPMVRAAVAEKGLSSFVTFAGYQKGEDFVRWLQALDEVWVLGLGNDYSGRAAAQARACGARVVAVAEGGLAVYADVTVEPDAASIARASLSGTRRRVTLPSAADVAAQVIGLYETAAG